MGWEILVIIVVFGLFEDLTLPLVGALLYLLFR